MAASRATVGRLLRDTTSSKVPLKAITSRALLKAITSKHLLLNSNAAVMAAAVCAVPVVRVVLPFCAARP